MPMPGVHKKMQTDAKNARLIFALGHQQPLEAGIIASVSASILSATAPLVAMYCRKTIVSEVNRIWRLRKRPVGDITDDSLSFEEESLPEPSDGEFLFRLNYLSLDPTNRIWMSDMDQYMPPVEPFRVCFSQPSFSRFRIVERKVVYAIFFAESM